MKNPIYDNGTVREMTAAEIEEGKNAHLHIPSPLPTEQEQIDALRQENEDLWLALAQIELGGEMV